MFVTGQAMQVKRKKKLLDNWANWHLWRWCRAILIFLFNIYSKPLHFSLFHQNSAFNVPYRCINRVELKAELKKEETDIYSFESTFKGLNSSWKSHWIRYAWVFYIETVKENVISSIVNRMWCKLLDYNDRRLFVNVLRHSSGRFFIRISDPFG